MAIAKFNDGQTTSDDINRQFRDEFVSKAVVEVAGTLNKHYFSSRADMEDMPENHGDTFTKMLHFPLLHKDNMSDLNLDAASATIAANVVYIVDTNHNVVSKFDVEDFLVVTSAAGSTVAISQGELDNIYDGSDDATVDAVLAKARANAVVAANAASGANTVMAGAGMIRNGYAPYAMNSGSLANLPETGGVVNLLNGKSKLISAKLTKHGIGTQWSVDSVKLSSQPKKITRKIREIADAQLDIKELQVQYDLLEAGELNSIVATNANYLSADTIQELGAYNEVSYEALEQFQQALMEDDVPTDTKIVSGTDKVDTKVVEEAYIVNINRELLPTLRRITGPGGTIAWNPYSKYAAGDDVKIKGEVGMIEGLMFRFVVTPDLMIYRGAGLATVVADDAGAVVVGGDTKVNYDKIGSTSYTTNGKFDVFNMVVIGDDSFNTIGLTSDNSSAGYIAPKKDNYNDMHGEIAGISTKWRHGTLVYRPERIKILHTISKKI